MSIASIAASGMNAAALRQQVAAGNIARLGVTDSVRQGVTTSTLAGGGVSASVTVEPVDASAPVSDLVDSLAASSDFKANAKALARADEMVGSLLDVVA
ncbi:hypothetical protein [Stenotrophomonas sp. MMGLT7]|uniref:hypothetical protein n=1 Tax=Stenotrophomonas sp. MMGLT7 TaxID=2901227 RepID=UPI001E5E1063|nr:hypothetical protein [Stenotrophomonas sp. MMGLT7]MCD7097157.1 hypothetical protein [Stenotrophomonas sp. MMGLT7]